MLKNSDSNVLSIEAIVHKASLRKSFDEIPSDMKKLFLE